MMDNQQFNRYAPPRTNGEPDSTRHGNYLAEPQALPAGNAKEWIGAAWRLFKLRPGKLIGAVWRHQHRLGHDSVYRRPAAGGHLHI